MSKTIVDGPMKGLTFLASILGQLKCNKVVSTGTR